MVEISMRLVLNKDIHHDEIRFEKVRYLRDVLTYPEIPKVVRGVGIPNVI
jgi:hypothetical protein